MADVLISELPIARPGIPGVIPFSQAGVTSISPVSALFQGQTNVIIGGTTPSSYRLDVPVGTSNFASTRVSTLAIVRADNTTGADALIIGNTVGSKLRNNAAGVLGIHDLAASGKASIELGAGGGVITGQTGFIGINNTTPAFALDVTGDLRVASANRIRGFLLETNRQIFSGSQTGSFSTSSGSLGGIEIRGGGNITDASFLCFHRPGYYATYFGLDTDNKLKWGGWSAGTSLYEIYHTGNILQAGFSSGQITSALGYTPVQQGGGIGQAANKLYIGWSGNNLLLQVDATNFGSSWPINVTGSSASCTGNAATATTANALNLTNRYIIQENVLVGGTSMAMLTNNPNKGTLELRSINNTAAVMMFNRGTFYSYLGVDTDNQLKWGAGNNSGAWNLLHSNNFNTWVPDRDGNGARGTWPINITGTAAVASSIAWANVSSKPFNWNGQPGQPTWLWGSNDGTNYYVWNPSNFNVASANTISGTLDWTKIGGLNTTHNAQGRKNISSAPAAGGGNEGDLWYQYV